MQGILHDRYYNIGNLKKYLVQTWSEANSDRIKLPEVYGVGKSLDLKVQPEKPVINQKSQKKKKYHKKTKVRTRKSRIKMQIKASD